MTYLVLNTIYWIIMHMYFMPNITMFATVLHIVLVRFRQNRVPKREL